MKNIKIILILIILFSILIPIISCGNKCDICGKWNWMAINVGFDKTKGRGIIIESETSAKVYLNGKITHLKLEKSGMDKNIYKVSEALGEEADWYLNSYFTFKLDRNFPQMEKSATENSITHTFYKQK